MKCFFDVSWQSSENEKGMTYFPTIARKTMKGDRRIQGGGEGIEVKIFSEHDEGSKY